MEIPRYWRLNQARYNLLGEMCPNSDCNKLIFPPRDVCPACSGEAKIKPDEISGAIYQRNIRLANIPQKS